MNISALLDIFDLLLEDITSLHWRPSRDRDSIDGSSIDCFVKASRRRSRHRHRMFCAVVGCPHPCKAIRVRV